MITQVLMQQANSCWQLVTHLGSASLLMPTLIIAVIALWHSKQTKTVCIWMATLALAVILTLTSKVMFMGWGIGIAALDFTGVSGHTLLATSILPILFLSVVGGQEPHSKNIGLWFGLLLAFFVGLSRVALGMHSISEVIAGWMLGLSVCYFVLKVIKTHHKNFAYLQLAVLVSLLALGTTTPNYIPSHSLEIRLALYLSGREIPYTRSHFLVIKNQT